MSLLFGGVEAGGTKFLCGIGKGPDDLQSVSSIPTTTPAATLDRVVRYFRQQPQLTAIGIGSFGPVDIDPDSSVYGRILQTPKSDWVDTDILHIIRNALGVPVVIDTDVNAAALAEHQWGAARDLDSFLYLTIGTGIGGGGMVNGKLIHGLTHPEMGHIRLPHDRQHDSFHGSCPFHGDCFEGLASGSAIKSRWGLDARAIPDEHPAWELESSYIALALHNYITVLSPQRIVIGGGIMQRKFLFPKVREKLRNLLNAYITSPALSCEIDQYIVPPQLGHQAGLLGAIALAKTVF